MSKQTEGAQLARQAVVFLNAPTIPYSQWDCQGFMEQIFKACGNLISYRGSNDMYRNACSWVGTLEEAKRRGYLVPGCALFIVKQDGKEPARYQGDGKGNASHVGMYIGERAYYDPESSKWCDVAHSSASRGKVCGSTLKNGWTHVGIWKAMVSPVGQHSSETSGAPHGGTVGNGGIGMTPMIVQADTGSNVMLRPTPSTKGNYMARIPVGEQVMAQDRGDGWSAVEWQGMRGYMMSKFLRYPTAQNVPSPSPEIDGIYDPEDAPETVPPLGAPTIFAADVEGVLVQAKTLVAALEGILNSKG